jgi:hypothetical protein
MVTLLAWTVMGVITIHALHLLNIISLDDLPEYGLDPDTEFLLHPTACYLFFPYSIFKAIQNRDPR